MTRSATSATTPRSWVIEDDGGADAALEVAHQIEDLRLDGDVERGGRLVGDQELRIAGERHRDHHALPHAARKLVRIFAHAPARLRDADEVQHLDRALPRPPCWSRPSCRRSVSPIWRPTVSTGLRLVIGSWKIMLMSLPRMLAHLAIGELQQIACPRSGSRRRSCRAAPGSAAGSTLAVTDLPQPLSPTIASVSPGVDMERDAVDRAVDAVRRAKMRLQVFDLEQRHRVYSPLAMRGSSASRRPSPSRLTASTVTDRKAAGKNTM